MKAPATITLIGHEIRDFKRSGSLLAAIALGGILVVVALVLADTLTHRIDDGAAANYDGADIIVRTSTGAANGAATATAMGDRGFSEADQDKLARIPGVRAVDGMTRARAGLWFAGEVSPTVIESAPTGQFRWQRLIQGHLPDTPTEVALSQYSLDERGLAIGDEVTLATDEAGDGQFTIVGAIDTRGALDYDNSGYAVLTPDLANAFAGIDSANEIRIALEPGTDTDEVMGQINAAVPGGWPERTQELIESTKTLYSVGLGALNAFVTGFAYLAVVISLIVLGTVTWSSLPGRRRHLALMRLVGASKAQIFTVMILESALLALVAGIIALPLGIAASYAAFPLLGALPGVPQVPLSQITLPAAKLLAVPPVAVIGAILAVVVPAFGAARVSPAEALRRASIQAPVHPARDLVHLLICLALALIVALAPLFNATSVALIAAGIFLIALVTATPAMSRVGAWGVDKLVSDKHPLAEIGASETASFPGRSAATGTAALLAAMVTAMSWVALSSLVAMADDRSSDDPGPQLMVGAYSGQAPLDPVVMQALGDIDGVSSTAAVPMGRAEIKAVAPEDADTPAPRVIKEIAAGAAEDFADSAAGVFPLEHSDPETLYLPAADGESTPFADRSTVILAGPHGEDAVNVRYIKDLPLPGLASPELMERVGIVPAEHAMWIGVSDEANRSTVLESVETIATIGGDLPVTGTVVTDSTVDELITAAKRLATAMLSVAVIIAIVGAVVTLSISVRDRTGDFAVLRLLGMEGAQLRRLVGGETLIIGSAAVLIGLAAGSLIGAVSASAIAGLLGVDTAVAIPIVVLAVMGIVTVAVLRMAATRPIDTISLVAPATALRNAQQEGN